MSVAEEDGASLRIHLQRLADSTKKIDPRLNNELPDFAQSLWVIYNGLVRPQSMSGVARISNQEIAAYQLNHDIKLNAWELEMIEMLDAIAIEVFSKKDN